MTQIRTLLPLLLVCATSVPLRAVLTVNETEITAEFLSENATVSNGGTLRLTGTDPFGAFSVDLEDHSCTLILERLAVSEATPLMNRVTVAGLPFDATKDRLSIYGNGSEVYPDGWSEPLTVYTQESYGGNSLVCEVDKYYRGKKVKTSENFLEQVMLEDFDNAVRSFKLRRGYTACFANNPDGTGFSRVFVASDKDIEVPSMPQGLEYVSFIRVSRTDRVGKRGICGLDVTPLTRSAWYYSWGASDDSTDDFEFVPMRHNRWWDGWDKIGSRVNTSNVLGYNEPDHADQSDLSPWICIENWPEFMKSGLRVGSPAPDCINKDWLKQFLAAADSLNYRVDFVATHMYWNSQDPQKLADNIDDLCVNTYGGRPMWITEWNNGANWTHEQWPDQKGIQLDADFNPLPDENGNTVEVNRPHTEANSAKQCEWLAEVLKTFDSSKWLERHSFYNWVEDARSVVIDGKLTPAGRIFADFRSVPGFSRSREYIHTWHIAPPRLSIRKYSSYHEIEFYDHNGENGAAYILERRIDNGGWEQIATLRNGQDYSKAGAINRYKPEITTNGTYHYRMKGVDHNGNESIYSRQMSVKVENSAVADIAATHGRVYAVNGILYIESKHDGEIAIYNMDGTAARRLRVSQGLNTISDLPRGIYIVNRQKLII